MPAGGVRVRTAGLEKAFGRSDCVSVQSQRVMLTFPLNKQNEKEVNTLEVDK